MEVRFTVPGEPTGKGRPQTKVMYSAKGFTDKKTGKRKLECSWGSNPRYIQYGDKNIHSGFRVGSC